MKKWIWAAVLVVAGMLGMWFVGLYNGLVRSDQAVQAQWGQVQNVYQRRLDLVPNLVETVKGSAAFEKETLTAVIEARAKATQVTATAPAEILQNPAAFAEFQKAQQSLGAAIGRLLVSVENYPQLRSTDAFRDLQAQLEGTENRIAVERMRFNDVSREYNTRRDSFPSIVVANWFGARFAEKPYFQAEAAATHAPEVKF